MIGVSRGKVDRCRLAIGNAGPRPLAVDEADRILRGREPSPDLIEQAAQAARRAAEGTMVENAGAPVEYRRKMVAVMARRTLTEALARAQG